MEETRRGFFWFMMVAGLVIIAYFTLNMAFNFVFAVDLAGDGVNVVLKEAEYDDGGNLIAPPEVLTLHGVTGWVEGLAPWMAVNGFTLALGSLLLGLGYVMTGRMREKAAVSIFKMRLLGWYLGLVAALMFVLGVDRVFFIPHGVGEGLLSWMDWYVLEFLAHTVWAVVLLVLAAFFLRVEMVQDEGTSD
ncbi:MAG: hypothetical protein HPY75_07865 [Actinobacteria bacterium]|nr:hypothetical protein [Actinomycetota bacterium]